MKTNLFLTPYCHYMSEKFSEASTIASESYKKGVGRVVLLSAAHTLAKPWVMLAHSVESLVKGIINLFGFPYSKKCSFKIGLLQAVSSPFFMLGSTVAIAFSPINALFGLFIPSLMPARIAKSFANSCKIESDLFQFKFGKAYTKSLDLSLEAINRDNNYFRNHHIVQNHWHLM